MRLIAALLCLVACSRPAPPPRAPAPPPPATAAPVATAPAAAADAGPPPPPVSGPARMIEDRYFVAEGAPQPLACRADKDCIGDTVTDDTGCCVRDPETFPQTFAWHVWISERRLSRACGQVSCPPAPTAELPEACRLAARCDRGRCTTSCAAAPSP